MIVIVAHDFTRLHAPTSFTYCSYFIMIFSQCLTMLNELLWSGHLGLMILIIVLGQFSWVLRKSFIPLLFVVCFFVVMAITSLNFSLQIVSQVSNVDLFYMYWNYQGNCFFSSI